MPINKVPLKPGMSMSKFVARYGSEEYVSTRSTKSVHGTTCSI